MPLNDADQEEFDSELEDEEIFDAHYPPGVEIGGLKLAHDYGSGSFAQDGRLEVAEDKLMLDGETQLGGPASEDGQSEIGNIDEVGWGEYDNVGGDFNDAVGAAAAADRDATEIGSNGGYISKYGPSEIGVYRGVDDVGAAAAADREATEIGLRARAAMTGPNEIESAGEIEPELTPFDLFMAEPTRMGAADRGYGSEIGAADRGYGSEIGGIDDVGNMDEVGSAAMYGPTEIGHDDDFSAVDRNYYTDVGAAEAADRPGSEIFGASPARAVAKVIETARDNRQPPPPMRAVDVDAPSLDAGWDEELTDTLIGAATTSRAVRSGSIVASPSGNAYCSCPTCGAQFRLVVDDKSSVGYMSAMSPVAQYESEAASEAVDAVEDAKGATESKGGLDKSSSDSKSAAMVQAAPDGSTGCRCPKCGTKLKLVLAPQAMSLMHSRRPMSAMARKFSVVGATVSTNPDPFPLTSEFMLRCGAGGEPRFVRVDTEESYKQFRAEHSPELADLSARLEAHISDPNAHSGEAEFSDDLSDDIEDLVHLGAEAHEAEDAKRIELWMPKRYDGLVTAWREGDFVCATLTLPGSDGEVRFCTSLEPVRKCVAEMSRHAAEAGVPASTVVGVLPAMGCVLGAGTALKEMAAAAPSILQRPEAAGKGSFMVRIEPKTSPALCALAMLVMACRAGNAQACNEWKRLGELAPAAVRQAMVEAVQIVKAAA